MKIYFDNLTIPNRGVSRLLSRGYFKTNDEARQATAYMLGHESWDSMINATNQNDNLSLNTMEDCQLQKEEQMIRLQYQAERLAELTGLKMANCLTIAIGCRVSSMYVTLDDYNKHLLHDGAITQNVLRNESPFNSWKFIPSSRSCSAWSEMDYVSDKYTIQGKSVEEFLDECFIRLNKRPEDIFIIRHIGEAVLNSKAFDSISTDQLEQIADSLTTFMPTDVFHRRTPKHLYVFLDDDSLILIKVLGYFSKICRKRKLDKSANELSKYYRYLKDDYEKYDRDHFTSFPSKKPIAA